MSADVGVSVSDMGGDGADSGVTASTELPAGAGGESGSGAAPASAPSGSWLDSLDADLRGDPTLVRFKSPADLAKSYLEARKQIGKQGIQPPGPDATPEQRAAFYKALGRPDDPTGYDFGDFAPPEGVDWKPEAQAAIVQVMHEAGVSNEQAKALLGKYADLVGGAVKEQTQRMEAMMPQAERALQERWGAAYPKNVELAATAAEQVFGEQWEGYASAIGPSGVPLGSDPAFLSLLADYGQAQAEHGKLKGATPRQYAMTPEEAQSKLDELVRKPGAYQDKAIMRQITDLNMILTAHRRRPEDEE
jgi:hypothetical protein